MQKILRLKMNLSTCFVAKTPLFKVGFPIELKFIPK